MNTEEKQAHWLSDYYSQVADGGEMEFYSNADWDGTVCGPSMISNPNDWRIKPTTKVVDMSVLIEGIDCEFSDIGEIWIVGKLTTIRTDTGYRYKRLNGNGFRMCRPRMSPHVHYWGGGVCPLPEGVLIKAKFRDTAGTTICSPRPATCLRWSYLGGEDDIVGFEVMPELAEGWAYEPE